MTNQEAFGASYLWGPVFYQIIISRLGGDISYPDFQRGGRFSRVNRYESNFSQSDWKAALEGKPENTISFRQKGKAEYYRQLGIVRRMGLGEERSQQYAENQLKRMGWINIRKNLLRHFGMTPLFAWRGIWSYPNKSIHFGTNAIYIIAKDFFALFTYVSLFALFIYGVITRNLKFIGLTILPAGIISIYSLMTHNIPRYTSIASPLMISLVVICDKLFFPLGRIKA